MHAQMCFDEISEPVEAVFHQISFCQILPISYSQQYSSAIQVQSLMFHVVCSKSSPCSSNYACAHSPLFLQCRLLKGEGKVAGPGSFQKLWLHLSVIELIHIFTLSLLLC